MNDRDMHADEWELAAARVSADPAFVALEASGAPLVAAAGDPPRVVYTNDSALALFGGDLRALTKRLFEDGEAGARRLSEIVESVRHGAAPRLERLRLSFGSVAQTVTILCRKTSGASGPPFFVIAVLGVRPAQQRTEAISSSRADAGEDIAKSAPSPIDAPVSSELGADAAARGARRPRFLWRTDAAGRFAEVTAALAQVVGRSCADLEGRALGEVAQSFGLDPDRRLSETLAQRKSWSGVEVSWPIADRDARVPVVLGALPVFDEARRFCGFKGYGVLHLDRTETTAPPAPAAAPAPAVRDSPSGEPSTEGQPPVSAFADSKVVPLRPLNSVLRSVEPIGDAVSDAPAQSSARAEEDRLTSNERDAFAEIGRALGVAGEAESAKARAPDLTEIIGRAVEEDAPPFVEPASESDALSRRARDILDHLPVGVLVARDANALFANRTLLDYLGYADIEALRADGGLARAFSSRPEGWGANAPSGAVEVQAHDGETLDVDARFQTIEWDDGSATLITLRAARKPARADDALLSRTSELETDLARARGEADELRAILEAMDVAAAVIDREGRIESVNRSLANLFGRDQAAFSGDEIASLFAEEDRNLVADRLSRGGEPAVSGDGLPGGGLRISAKTRERRVVPVHLTIRKIGSGPEPKYCAIVRVESARANGDLEAARREAERASAAKSDFLARVSHEIRTPLNAVLGFAEVMMEERFGPIGNERYKEYVKDVHTCGTHVLSLVNDLLDLSKIEAGKMELEFQRVDANAVISECVSIMQPQANRARVVVRLSLSPRLPRIRADERSLRQIVLNLLSNAVKFNEVGGQVIVSTALTDAGLVAIRVKDTGIGMSEGEVEAALEPFCQLATSRNVSGTGLGLPLTKALIEANHACFSIRSRKHEGTLVEVAFPPPQARAAE